MVESPLSGDFDRNRRYAVAIMRDCLLNHGEAPYASHLLYTQMLDDENVDERRLGMEAGIDRARARGAEIVYRSLPDWEDMEFSKTSSF